MLPCNFFVSELLLRLKIYERERKKKKNDLLNELDMGSSSMKYLHIWSITSWYLSSGISWIENFVEAPVSLFLVSIIFHTFGGPAGFNGKIISPSFLLITIFFSETIWNGWHANNREEIAKKNGPIIAVEINELINIKCHSSRLLLLCWRLIAEWLMNCTTAVVLSYHARWLYSFITVMSSI